MVGPHVGEVGLMGQVGHSPCPEEMSSSPWRYRVGPSLEVSCSPPNVEMDIQEVKGNFSMKNMDFIGDIGTWRTVEDLSKDIEDSLGDMLSQEKEVSDQVEFKVTVEKILFSKAVVDFKIQYNVIDPLGVVPFEMRPVNVSEVLNKDFKYRRGVLFEKYPVDENSLHCSSASTKKVEDTCAVLNCSHKCGYDYGREEFVCSCPENMTLEPDNNSCTPSDLSYTTTTLPTTIQSNTILPNTSIPTTLLDSLLSTLTTETFPESLTTNLPCSDCSTTDSEVTTTQAPLETTTVIETTVEDSHVELSTLSPIIIIDDAELPSLYDENRNQEDDEGVELTGRDHQRNLHLPVYSDDRYQNMTTDNEEDDLGMNMTTLMDLMSSNAFVDEDGARSVMFDCVKAQAGEIESPEWQTVLQCKILDKENGEKIFIIVDKNVLTQSAIP